MNDTQGLDACALGIVDIFIEQEASVVAVIAAQIDFGIESGNRTVARALRRTFFAVLIGKGNLHAVNEHEIFDVGLGLDDARLHLYVSALIGVGKQNALLSDGNENDLIALFERAGQFVIFHRLGVNGVKIVAVFFEVYLNISACFVKGFRKVFAFAFLFHLFKLRKDIIAGNLCAFHHTDRGRLGFFKLFCGFRLALGNEIIHLRLFAPRLREKHFGFRFGGLHGDAFLFKAFDDRFKAAIFSRNVGFCAFNDGRGKPKLLGDGKRIGFTGRTDDELIGRTERIHVKLTGSIANAVRIERVGFELRIVCGCGAKRVFLAYRFQNGNGKRRALDGVCSRAHFVEEDEASALDVCEHLHDMHHMRGERGKRLLNALFITDIREDIVENAHHRAVSHGDMKSRLGHDGKKSERFEGNGLTARIRTRDDKGIEILAERNGDGHDLVRGNERMACTEQIHFSCRRDLGGDGIELIGKLALAENKGKERQIAIVFKECGGDHGDIGGKLGKDSFDLVCLLSFEQAKLVVGFDNGKRFDKERRARSGRIVNQTLDLIFVFLLDGDNVSAVAHGNDGFL